MVLGPSSSGKTTVVKSLVNMALGSGMGWSVGLVGLDPASVSRPLKPPETKLDEFSASKSHPRIRIFVYTHASFTDTPPRPPARLRAYLSPS